jgi:hypothetical protein
LPRLATLKKALWLRQAKGGKRNFHAFGHQYCGRPAQKTSHVMHRRTASMYGRLQKFPPSFNRMPTIIDKGLLMPSQIQSMQFKGTLG